MAILAANQIIQIMKLRDEHKVSIVAGVCLFTLVAVLKNVLFVPSDILSRDILVYIVIYWAFTFFPLKKEEVKRSKFDKPLFWSLLIVLITLIIIVMYAI